VPLYIVSAVILSFHIIQCGAKMTDNNPKPPPDTPDSDDFCNQWPFELSEYLQFDDNQWMQDDIPSFSSENVSNQVHQASNGSYFEGSSSSKHI